ncbi:uncharacterized protein LOC142229288 [Haematobia irritans]|uniref:uncharacterized protein LOC142229288 n=1 Tax=Haematobia irritans TaxID=7368 RepID=UPI003F4FAFC1
MSQMSPHDKLLNKNIVFNGTYPIDMPLKARFKNYDPEANSGGLDEMYEAYISSHEDDDDEDDDEDDDDDDEDIEYNEDQEMASDEVYMPYAKQIQDLESDNSHYFNYHRHRRQQDRHKALASYGIIRAQQKAPNNNMHTLTQTVPQVWSMQELIHDRSIPLNYKKMCHEVEHSLQQFEKYIDSKSGHNHPPATSSSSTPLSNQSTNLQMFSTNKQKTFTPPVVKTFNIDDPIDLKKNK